YARGEDVWERRYRQINDWERFIVENGFPIVKIFLNLSKEEQRRRFLRRIDYPDNNWKFNAHDVKERDHWDEYQVAFSQMLSATSTECAPWYVIPADHKWYMRLVVGQIIVKTLKELDLHIPDGTKEREEELAEGRRLLLAEGRKAKRSEG